MAANDDVNHSDTRTLERIVDVGPLPTDDGSNASYSFTFTGDNLTTVTKTLKSTVFTRTLTYSGSQISTISVWS